MSGPAEGDGRAEEAGDAATGDGVSGVPDDVLLRVDGLEKHYPVTEGLLRREVGSVRAVDGVSFQVEAGEAVGLIGESGSGKSTVATSLVRVEEPTGGTVTFDGQDVGALEGSELKRFRRRVGMVFQDPVGSFDPRMTVGESVAEPLAIHALETEKREAVVADLLERVGLTAGDAHRYPHELSGGQKQRAGLARALSLDPDLLVADEPVSALDVSVQAEILALLDDLRDEFDLSMLLISHDMAVVREVCDRVNVMYAGEIVERGPTEDLFREPQHPYTEALVASVPTPDPRAEGRREPLRGEVPDPADPPPGCRFHTRCPRVIQPEGWDLDQTGWRRLLDFRVALRDDDHEFPNDPAEVRDAFDVPREVGDPEADAVIAQAVEDVASGGREAARERLGETFETVCERESPAMYDTGEGHPAACHLHGEEHAASFEFGDVADRPTADD